MNEQTYISRQISVYMTDKKLVEFLDKLKPAPTEYYAHIHSFGDKDEDGVKQISCVGILLQDYSNGTGKNTVRVAANICPDEAEYIFLPRFMPNFNYFIISVPINGRRTSGIVTEPSAFWKFSRIHATVLPTATPLPFKV